jgi:hypothetical protein
MEQRLCLSTGSPIRQKSDGIGIADWLASSVRRRRPDLGDLRCGSSFPFPFPWVYLAGAARAGLIANEQRATGPVWHGHISEGGVDPLKSS